MDNTGQRRIDLAYAAGLVDGEGCFEFHSTTHIKVESTSRLVIEKMRDTFGGSCAVSSRRTALNRVVFLWNAYGSLADSVSKELAEFLIEKQVQAILLSRIRKYPPGSAMRKSLQSRLKALKRTAS